MRKKVSPVPPSQNGRIQELTLQEGQELLEARAQHYLGISAAEFVRRWDTGQYANVDSPEVLRVAMALPFVRR